MGKCTFGKLPLFLHGEVATWEIVTWENVHSGSCPFSLMGKLPLGKLSFGKMYIWEVAAWEFAHLGSCHLGKHPWEVSAWEVALGKVPNISPDYDESKEKPG